MPNSSLRNLPWLLVRQESFVLTFKDMGGRRAYRRLYREDLELEDATADMDFLLAEKQPEKSSMATDKS